MRRTVFAKGLGTVRCQAVTLGQLRAITADLPDDTPLAFNDDDGRSDELLSMSCASVQRRAKVYGLAAGTAVVFEA